MAEISWIKLKTTMFDDEKIKLIQSMPEADAILVIWIRLLVLAGKTNDEGLIYIQRNMPYTEEMLATLFSKPVNVVRLALMTLQQFNMIDLNEDGLIAIENWDKHQNIEGMEKVRLKNAERVRKHRERKKQQALEDKNSGNVTCNVTVTDCNGTDKDIDKEIDIDKDKKNRSKTSCKYSDEHLRLAEKLKNNLINDFPSEMKRVNIEKWADTFRLIEERDQQTIAAIDYVLDWLPTNSFWFGNIRSASKLRTQFEKLKFEIKNEKERGQQRAAYQRQNVRTENLPEWAKEPNNQQEEKLSPEEQAELDRQIKEYLEGK
ncbi:MULTISPECIES: phage replisome organizer N-terminal domain-containing protein [Bacillota]|jgi:predicted phage replisome organizer|uniref:phage replisome organizer N-terminal domain-containing protein n=1 Tax=Bacillota TaxID=1239 RepID=UPI000D50EA1A|nr:MULTISPECIES: phage replisome organizer N-terminal domain-containing protein [Bacillota]EHF1795481.1 phage replisome organizer [Enterococcus faecalis]EHK9417921.1 phage replisome organizer N-terminal domain-containing protein [Enterococcus faecalis]EHP0863138.1 phage replisome organizer N-terminal domain-containing protein [Enterococcus faecalis]EHV0171886.1 phage replisome organizer N-terminal domain-containing protein [Enterococcus faecalis]EIT2056170.1 phage replisome organizer N-termina